MTLSLSGFLFEDDYTSQSITFAEFCSIARMAGYNGVELRNTQVNPATSKRERRKLLDIVQDAGLEVTCLTARYLPASGPERDEAFIRYLDLCRDMGCNLLKVGGDILWLRNAASKAEEYGVTLAVNNHVGGPLQTVSGTRQFFRQAAHPNLGLLYDPFHLGVIGEDYIGCIDEFIGITRNILVQSAREARPGERVKIERNGRRWTAALPDEPAILQDWLAIFRAFRRLGYDKVVTVIENGWPVTQREYVARHCAKVIWRLWSEGEEV